MGPPLVDRIWGLVFRVLVPFKYIEYGLYGDLDIIYTPSHILSTYGGR